MICLYNFLNSLIFQFLDHSVYIIRDGMSVVQENGSLQLEKEEDILGSGSLAMIPTSSPQQKLPPLPSNIDEVAFTWRADAPVSLL